MEASIAYNEVVSIPLVIGITGHRNINPDEWDNFQTIVSDLFHTLQKRYPYSPVTVLSSLAEGADQLCAEVALQVGFTLEVPLPMEESLYLQTFSPEGKLKYYELLSGAKSSFVVPLEEPNPLNVSNGFYYRQAGIYTVIHSHILLALWDGEDYISVEGGGTAETVGFMLRHDWHSTSDVMPFSRLGDGVVWHIATPRENKVLQTGIAGTLSILSGNGVGDQFPATLSQIEAFNADVQRYQNKIKKHASSAQANLWDNAHNDNMRRNSFHSIAVFKAADCLALLFRNRRLCVLRLLSGLGATLVFLFLLYDEMESDLMLLLYGLVLITTFIIFWYSKNKEYHRKFIHYRLLAEALRIGIYWHKAGIPDKVWNQYTWSQRMDILWIKNALVAISVSDFTKELPSLEDVPMLQKCWIADQMEYHIKAKIKKERQLVKNQKISRFLICVSISLFILVFILEFFAKDWITMVIPTSFLSALLWMHPDQDILLRSIVKIMLGTVSAGTALLSNYFGKLSLALQAREDSQMVELYKGANQFLLLHKSVDKEAYLKVMYQLGRESIIENGNWLLNYLDQSPDIII